jgi:hypothetical protein
MNDDEVRRRLGEAARQRLGDVLTDEQILEFLQGALPPPNEMLAQNIEQLPRIVQPRVDPNENDWDDDWDEDEDDYEDEDRRIGNLLDDVFLPKKRRNGAQPQVRGKIPEKTEIWRNIQTQQAYEILNIKEENNQKIVVMTSCKKGDDLLEVKLPQFQETWEKFTPTKSASSAEPHAGETWQNIHTGFKASIESIQQGRNTVEVTWMRNGKTTTSDMKTFMANWRRVKSASQWFVGLGLKLGK